MWKDSIQRLFRYRKITPSPTLWEQLEAQLAESEAQQARQNSRKVLAIVPRDRVFVTTATNQYKP